MNVKEARIVFMGTPDFAVPALSALCEDGFHVVGVVTQPDKPSGRKRILTPPPIKVEAMQRGLSVFQPERVRRIAALDEIRAMQPDVLVTCAYGQILPQALLDIPTIGSINVHASLLPRWRGAAPIQRAVMAGDRETGISIMEMVEALDAGQVYATVTVPIGPDDTFGQMHDALAVAGGGLLVQTLPGYIQRQLSGTPQDEHLVTYAHRILREDEWVDWTQSGAHVHNQIRGLSPFPGAATRLADQVMKIGATRRRPGGAKVAEPGTVVVDGSNVLVACQDEWLQLSTVQPAGKRPMSAGDWIRGVKQERICFSSVQLESPT